MIDASSSRLNHQIGVRVRRLREADNLSLDALASRSGVSRSMISVIERGESSPTAVVLDKLAGALGVTLPSLFEQIEGAGEPPRGPLARRGDQPEWRDPVSGYVRRNVSPAGVRQPIQISEIRFPAGASVAFESAAHGARLHEQVWLLEGAMDVTVGQERYRLRAGDCLALRLEGPTVFHNPTRKPARYAVVIASESARKG